MSFLRLVSLRTVLFSLIVGLVLFASLPAKADLVINEFMLSIGGSYPTAITAASDGNLWFTEKGQVPSCEGGNKIGRITPIGFITEFTVPSSQSEPWGITVDPQGNLWFTESSYIYGNKIGRITPAGVITEFPLPTSNSIPWDIIADADGNLWFTELSGKIGRITPAGDITEFPVPECSNAIQAGCQPYGITIDPDGNLWFTEELGNKIGRITPSGVITEFEIPTADSLPRGITTGPDGNLWFTEAMGYKIGRITPSGIITEFSIPTLYFPEDITTGPVGNLWFTERSGKIGRITPSGVITEFNIPTPDGDTFGIISGPDGNIWFTEWSGNKIGQLILATVDSADTTPPTTTSSPAGGTYNHVQHVTLSCNDGVGSGCQTTFYCIGSGCNPTIGYFYSEPIDISAPTVLRFYSIDNENNIESVKTEVYTGNLNESYKFDFAWGSSGSGNGQFDGPFGVAVDSVDNVYVVDLGNNRIQKFSPEGTYLDQWELQPSAGAHGVAVDSSDNVYVVYTNSNSIEKYSPSGVLLKQWGSAGSGDGLFWQPIGVAVDSSDNVYVADMGNYRIQKFNADGNYLTQWGSCGNSNGKFSNPYAVAVDSAGNVYVSDTGSGNHRIQKFNSSGNYLTQWNIQFSNAMGLTVDSSDNIYVGSAGIIEKFSLNGNLLTEWGNGQFGETWGVAVDSVGNVYVSDTYSNRILKFGTTTDTTPPSTTASPSGGTYGAAQDVTLTCDDNGGSGCQTTYYCLGSGCMQMTDYSEPIHISSSTVLKFYSKDNANNSEVPLKIETYTITSSLTHTITVSTVGNGSILPPEPSVIVNHGDTKTFTLQPGLDNKVVMSGTCGGNIDPYFGTYRTNPITQDCEVIATFIPIPGGPTQELQLPSGDNVQVLVPVNDPPSGFITITFDHIATGGGTLTVSEMTSCNQVTGFTFLGSCFNIEFDGAPVPGSFISVTIPYALDSLNVPEYKLVILHDGVPCFPSFIGATNDPNIHTLTCHVTSLSPFGIGYYTSGGGYSTGANTNMIAILALLALSMGVFLIRKRRTQSIY